MRDLSFRTAQNTSETSAEYFEYGHECIGCAEQKSHQAQLQPLQTTGGMVDLKSRNLTRNTREALRTAGIVFTCYVYGF